MSIKAPKGTKDILPGEIANWQNIESIAYDVFSKANFKQHYILLKYSNMYF